MENGEGLWESIHPFMEVIYALCIDNLALIYFIYGLSFLIMGVSILAQPKGNSSFEIAKILRFLVAYSLIHVLADFIQVWSFFKTEYFFLIAYSTYISYISYLFLFEFGRRIFKISFPGFILFSPLLLPAAVSLALIAAITTNDFIKNLNVAVGYFIRFPSGLMAGIGLILYYNKNIRPIRTMKLKKNFYSAGFALCAWAFLCGIIRNEGDLFLSPYLNSDNFFEIFHMPVQLFRSVLAIILTWGFIGILRIFNWEYNERLIEANSLLDEKIRLRTMELRKSLDNLNQEIFRRKKAQRELSRLSRFQQSIIDGIEDSLVVIDNNFKILMMNKKARETYLKNEDAEPVYCYDIINHNNSAECRAGHSCLFKKAKKSARAIIYEYKTNGGTREAYYEVIAAPLINSSGNMNGLIEIIRDVTHRKNLERDILEISERERAKIARDIHDDLGQNLLAVNVLSKMLHQKTDINSDEYEIISNNIKFTEKAIELSRNIARGLSSYEINSGNFQNMLNILLKDMGKVFKIKFSINISERIKIKDDNTAQQLYKIIQEAVKNSINHGQAGKVSIEIKNGGASNILTVSDDGTGIVEKNIYNNPDSLGLKIMTYRADLIGGKISIINNKDKGASVICSF